VERQCWQLWQALLGARDTLPTSPSFPLFHRVCHLVCPLDSPEDTVVQITLRTCKTAQVAHFGFGFVLGFESHYVARLASNSQSSCFHLMNAVFTGVCHHAWPIINIFLSKGGNTHTHTHTHSVSQTSANLWKQEIEGFLSLKAFLRKAWFRWSQSLLFLIDDT
jgi:hypothetical protein